MSRILIELQGDETLGLGETDDAPGVYEALELICRSVVGRRIRHYRMLHDTIWPDLSSRLRTGFRSAFGAVENAAWDLAARQFGVPLGALLSGRHQSIVPIHGTVFLSRFCAYGNASETSPAHLDDAIDRSRQAGAGTIIYPSGEGDWLRDVEILRAIRAAMGPSTGLAFDGGGHYTSADLTACAQAIADLNLDYIIDPTPDLGTLVSVRAQIPCAVAAYRLLNSPADVVEAVRQEAADIILGDAARWGGIAPLLDCSALCRVFDLDFGLVSGRSVGISLATDIAVTLSEQAINRGISLFGGEPLASLLIDDELGLPYGRLQTATRPGIGVDLAVRRVKECWLAETVVE